MYMYVSVMCYYVVCICVCEVVCCVLVMCVYVINVCVCLYLRVCLCAGVCVLCVHVRMRCIPSVSINTILTSPIVGDLMGAPHTYMPLVQGLIVGPTSKPDCEA